MPRAPRAGLSSIPRPRCLHAVLPSSSPLAHPSLVHRSTLPPFAPTALLEVPPETLALEVPRHSTALLVSLQLRVQVSAHQHPSLAVTRSNTACASPRVQRSTTPPNLENIAAALDLVQSEGELDLVSACVRRRLELSQSRKDSIEALRIRIGACAHQLMAC